MYVLTWRKRTHVCVQNHNQQALNQKWRCGKWSKKKSKDLKIEIKKKKSKIIYLLQRQKKTQITVHFFTYPLLHFSSDEQSNSNWSSFSIDHTWTKAKNSKLWLWNAMHEKTNTLWTFQANREISFVLCNKAFVKAGGLYSIFRFLSVSLSPSLSTLSILFARVSNSRCK